MPANALMTVTIAVAMMTLPMSASQVRAIAEENDIDTKEVVKIQRELLRAAKVAETDMRKYITD